jgi:hypothetical protein
MNIHKETRSPSTELKRLEPESDNQIGLLDGAVLK